MLHRQRGEVGVGDKIAVHTGLDVNPSGGSFR
jgi:hypothetical protein